MEFTVLLDAPGKPVSRIQIAKLGDFHDARYGEFSITPENVANWQKHLSKLPGGEALIDFEHRSERKPRDSEAAGWISGIDLDGDKVMADARWTSKGEDAIKDERYRFLSPVYGATQVEGETLDDALPSVALTNKPYLSSMPSLCLASDERVSEAIDEDPALRFHVRALDGEYGEVTQALVMLDVSQAERDKAQAAGHSLPDGSYPIETAKQLHSAAVLAASGHGDVAAAKKLIRRRAKDLGVDVTTLPGFGQPKQMSADSRAPDMPSEEIIKLLDLDGDADDAKLLEAITGLKASVDEAAKLQKKLEKKPLKTLEQQAADNGLVLLEAGEVTRMRNGAAAGELAMKQLHETTRENAFAKALEQRKVTPAEKEDFDKLYELDSALAVKMLDGRQPVVPEMPAGAPALQLDEDADPEQVVRAGLHPDSHRMHQQIRKHMLEHKIPENQFAVVLDQVMAGAVRL